MKKAILILLLLMLVVSACSPVTMNVTVLEKQYTPEHSWTEPPGYRVDCGLYLGGYGCGYHYFYSPKYNYDPPRYSLRVALSGCNVTTWQDVGVDLYNSVSVGSSTQLEFFYGVPRECSQ